VKLAESFLGLDSPILPSWLSTSGYRNEGAGLIYHGDMMTTHAMRFLPPRPQAGVTAFARLA
jgi:hypothetical protein